MSDFGVPLDMTSATGTNSGNIREEQYSVLSTEFTSRVTQTSVPLSEPHSGSVPQVPPPVMKGRRRIRIYMQSRRTQRPRHSVIFDLRCFDDISSMVGFTNR